jgi:hypothetical protein
MTSFDNLYGDLEEYLRSLFIKFIEPYLIPTPLLSGSSVERVRSFLLKPEISSEQYELDVKAYTILSHASFEHYFEKVAIKVMENTISLWTNNREVSDSLICFLLYYTGESPSTKMDLSIDNKGKKKSIKDLSNPIYHIDSLTSKAENFFRNHVRNNHGASIDYLIELLLPVAIDIGFIDDPDISNALSKLKGYRGDFAHTMGGTISQIPNPIDIEEHVSYVLSLCKDIKDKANLKKSN